MATAVVDAEIERLTARLPDLDAAARAEVEHAVRRVADKLLHQPTVRVKELANEAGAVSYAAALAELFALDPDAVDAVTRTAGSPMSAPLKRRHPRLAAGPTQSSLVADRLAEALGVEVELVEVTTEGDVNGAPLASLGGAGVFVSALRDALLDGEVDVAVHSLKDLPTAPADGIALAAVPLREDPRDVARRPRRPHPRRAAGRQPRRHRLPAPGRPAARPRPRLGDRRASAATSTPGSARSRG